LLEVPVTPPVALHSLPKEEEAEFVVPTVTVKDVLGVVEIVLIAHPPPPPPPAPVLKPLWPPAPCTVTRRDVTPEGTVKVPLSKKVFALPLPKMSRGPNSGCGVIKNCEMLAILY
jgi:hypothetical protein